MNSYLIYKHKCGDVRAFKEGFNINGLLFSSLALLWQGLWRYGLSFLAFQVGLLYLNKSGFISDSAMYYIMLSISIFISYNMSHMAEGELKRAKYIADDLIFAESTDMALFLYKSRQKKRYKDQKKESYSKEVSRD